LERSTGIKALVDRPNAVSKKYDSVTKADKIKVIAKYKDNCDRPTFTTLEKINQNRLMHFSS